MVRYNLFLEESVIAALESWKKVSGTPVSAQIRFAISDMLDERSKNRPPEPTVEKELA